MTATALWVDDHVSSLKHYAKILQKLGVKVHMVSTPAAAIKAAKNKKFDAIYVDCRMPSMDGDKLIPELYKLAPSTAFAAVTSHISKYASLFGALNFKVSMIEKPLGINDSDETRFINKLKQCAYTKIPNQQHFKKDVSISEFSIDPFEISDDKYFASSINEHIELLKRVQKQVKDKLDFEFKNGACWVLFCGDNQKPAFVASSPDEIPSDQDILKLAREKGKAPFPFNSPLEVDDIWSGACNSDGIRGYPTVSIEFKQKTTLDFHFDTGCPTTFFDDSTFSMTSPASIGKVIQSVPINSKYEYAYRVDAQAYLIDQNSGETANVAIKGFSVIEWTSCSLKRDCQPEKCQAKDQRADGMCKFRTGLIGRNLLNDNKLSLILDGKAGRTRLS